MYSSPTCDQFEWKYWVKDGRKLEESSWNIYPVPPGPTCGGSVLLQTTGGPGGWRWWRKRRSWYRDHDVGQSDTSLRCRDMIMRSGTHSLTTPWIYWKELTEGPSLSLFLPTLPLSPFARLSHSLFALLMSLSLCLYLSVPFFICLCPSKFLRASVTLSLCLYRYASASVHLCLPASAFLYLRLHLSPSSLSFSICLCLCFFLCLPHPLCMSFSLPLPLSLPLSHSLWLSFFMRPSVSPSVAASVSLSVSIAPGLHVCQALADCLLSVSLCLSNCLSH